MASDIKYIYSDSLSSMETEVEGYMDAGYTPLNIIPGYPTAIWLTAVYKTS